MVIYGDLTKINMLIQNLFKKVDIFFGPERVGKSPEPQKKAPEAAKDNPNDLSKPQNREKLYKQAEELAAKLEKKGDAKSKKQAETLRKVAAAARNVENFKGEKPFTPEETAQILKTELDAIIRPEAGMVFAADKVTVKLDPKARAAAIAEARNFGMAGLLKGDIATPSKGGFESTKTDVKVESDEKQLAAASQEKVEVTPIVITASPTKEPPKPYNVLSVYSKEAIPMSARLDAQRVAETFPSGAERFYAATDGKIYRVKINKSVDGQSVLLWNRIEKKKQDNA